MKFKFNISWLFKLNGFTLMEAMVSVALISIATISAFSVIRVVSQGKYSLDDRHNFYLASLSYGANVDIALMEMTTSDIVAILPNDIVYTVGGACPANTGGVFRDRLKNELCRIKFLSSSTNALAFKSFKIQVINTVSANGSTKHFEIKMSFIDPTNNQSVFERIFLYVK